MSEKTIPLSPALAEAKPDSITELLSRDPMGASRVARDQVVAEFREARKRWEAIEAAGGHKRPRAPAKKEKLVVGNGSVDF